eukprot:747317-Pelagomonas_calceolata.AAC.8
MDAYQHTTITHLSVIYAPRNLVDAWHLIQASSSRGTGLNSTPGEKGQKGKLCGQRNTSFCDINQGKGDKAKTVLHTPIQRVFCPYKESSKAKFKAGIYLA